MIALAHRNAAPMAVLLFDLDGLKGVNDSLGHAAGDALLVSVAQRARSCMRASDTVGRLGGDEFLVLLPDTDREGARSVATKLLEALAQPFDIGTERVSVSASIGGSFLPGPSRDAEALVHAADEALYASKRGGRNRYTEGEPGGDPGMPSPGEA
jgi:diguanylate cyclase (GGDEF)-like protein